MRLSVLLLCAIFALSGCGSDETPSSIEGTPNYFPDAVGSRWVYRTAAGAAWVRAVGSDAIRDGTTYRSFTDTPAPQQTGLDVLMPEYIRVTPTRVLAAVGPAIESYIQTELPKLVADEFEGLALAVAVEPIAFPEFVLIQTPLTSGLHWDAFHSSVSGTIALQNLALLQLPFDMDIKVAATVLAETPLETPAGVFPETYLIEYRVEIAYTLSSEETRITQKMQAWFVPHVGTVRIEDAGGVTTLVGYTLAVPTEN